MRTRRRFDDIKYCMGRDVEGGDKSEPWLTKRRPAARAELVGCGINSMPNPPYISGVDNIKYLWLVFETAPRVAAR